MEVISHSKFIRISPRKMNLVAKAIRDLPLEKAMVALENLDRRAAKPIQLTFKQAIGNALNNFGLEKDSLKIKEIQVGKGPTLKRWRAASRGRAHQINKRTSHLKIILTGEKKEELKKQTAIVKTKKTTSEKGRSILARVTGRRNRQIKEKNSTKES